MVVFPQQGEIDFRSTVTFINLTQRSGGNDLQELRVKMFEADHVESTICVLRFKMRRHVAITPTQQLARLMQSCKTIINIKCILFQNYLKRRQKPHLPLFSLSCFSFVFKEYTAEHSSSSCPSYSFSCTHLFLDYR